MERHYHPLFSSTFFVVAGCLVATLMTMTALHAIIPHHHPGDPIQQTSPLDQKDGQLTYISPMTHGNEERIAVLPLITLAVILFMNILWLDNARARLSQTSSRNEWARRKPPFLLVLFSRGILHARIP